MPQTRLLAATIFTDFEIYSAMMVKDEQLTLNFNIVSDVVNVEIKV